MSAIKRSYSNDHLKDNEPLAKKSRDVEPLTAEQRILELIKASGNKGVSDDDLIKACPVLTIEERVDNVNKLITSNSITLHKVKDTLRYKYKGSSCATPGDANAEELVVFNLIRDSGRKGIWIRDVRIKSNLGLPRLKKILKSLEAKKSIKAVKSVAASRKIVYMLYDLEPDSSITGGAWYSNQEFESEFIEILTKHSYKFLEAKKAKVLKNTSVKSPLIKYNTTYATADRVLEFISKTGISKVRLSIEDITSILDLLVYDGLVSKRLNSEGIVEYRSTKSLVKRNAVSFIPCGSCPVIKRCSDANQLNSLNCKHMKNWTTI
ncbi:probable DNA-directed RNA polymerase III subunit RPC6 [Daktulosphaira vitifoliae]|uniref:probable DNA-directed RNA polymerase III subunit RPC6 n=1 Tax=Daktulosphaira vitifoliae TaxID=58002 RepID=UPI0021AA43EA|nr:probable DNA-directed RNA polymerase III subunit RPC6 [Daktulosphaira vitifoliae]